ncbi:hypothetical protein MHZ36_12775 [Staphylococcus sp. ACRSN]|uniref:hypothetical protein n=1 Tax=Staphylococcus TaxID=1279 RepID=UPI00164DBEDE|nr:MULTISPECIES: hypothetical protein [Staphylococcus]MCG7340163.1 hypothetical protein [Staphylococcus sp. ACRSN]
MPNENYQTVRISKEAYEQLREIKFKKNMSYINILNELIEKEYQNLKEENSNE